MEAITQPLNEHEIYKVLDSEGEIAGWRLVELIERGELGADVINKLPTPEEEQKLAKIVHLGNRATEHADVHREIAA